MCLKNSQKLLRSILNVFVTDNLTWRASQWLVTLFAFNILSFLNHSIMSLSNWRE